MKKIHDPVSISRLHEEARTLVTAHRGASLDFGHLHGLGVPGIMTNAPAHLVEWLGGL